MKLKCLQFVGHYFNFGNAQAMNGAVKLLHSCNVDGTSAKNRLPSYRHDTIDKRERALLNTETPGRDVFLIPRTAPPSSPTPSPPLHLRKARWDPLPLHRASRVARRAAFRLLPAAARVSLPCKMPPSVPSAGCQRSDLCSSGRSVLSG